MNRIIQPGDWVVLTGEKWGDRRYEIIQLKLGFIILDEPGYEIQRIQDYFEPGDKVETTCKDNYKLENRFIHHIENNKIYVSDHLFLVLPLEHNKVALKSIRNLTKEGRMNNEDVKKEKPMYLTAMELLEKDACTAGLKEFVNIFGKSEPLDSRDLKRWFGEHPDYKQWLKIYLPDHYAVIFDSWQPEINEIVWVQASHEWIGRYIKKSHNQHGKDVYQINGQWGDVYWLEIAQVKPISERPFQVGDYARNKASGCIYEVVGQLENSHEKQIRVHTIREYANEFELIISPAIPEVK